MENVNTAWLVHNARNIWFGTTQYSQYNGKGLGVGGCYIVEGGCGVESAHKIEGGYKERSNEVIFFSQNAELISSFFSSFTNMDVTHTTLYFGLCIFVWCF